jgi:regulator of sigma E protease
MGAAAGRRGNRKGNLMESALTNVYVIAAIVLLLGASIFVHEFGHFLVALLFRMKVDVFSLGFGPAIWKRKYKGIVFKIAWIPLGGYVALPQLDPTGMALIQGSPEAEKQAAKKKEAKDKSTKDEDDDANEEVRVLPRIVPWKKIIVSLAGGVGNILFAVLIACAVWVFGMPSNQYQRTARIGYVNEDSPAYAQGLRIGDTIRAVNRESVASWEDVLEICMLEEEVVIEAVSIDNTEKKATISNEPNGVILDSIGLARCVIAGVESNSPAEEVGLKPKDEVAEVDGVCITNTQHMIDLIRAGGERMVTIKVRRDDALMEFHVTPIYNPDITNVYVGVELRGDAPCYDKAKAYRIHPTPAKQLTDHATLLYRVVKSFRNRRQAKRVVESSGGPVFITGAYWHLATVSFMLALWFTGLINVQLAIINLLPIPVLDGGHIGFSIWESISGKPLHPKIVNGLVNVFFVLLVALMVLITVRDIGRTTVGDHVRDALNKVHSTNETDEATNAAPRSPDSTNDSALQVSP